MFISSSLVCGISKMLVLFLKAKSRGSLQTQATKQKAKQLQQILQHSPSQSSSKRYLSMKANHTISPTRRLLKEHASLLRNSQTVRNVSLVASQRQMFARVVKPRDIVLCCANAATGRGTEDAAELCSGRSLASSTSPCWSACSSSHRLLSYYSIHSFA